jgi:hypothetical protein
VIATFECRTKFSRTKFPQTEFCLQFNNEAHCYAKNNGIGSLLASILMAACGPHSTNPSTETLTVYEDAPALKPLDLGSPGNSPGDAYYFSAALHSSPGGPMIGEVFGSKTLIKSAPEANPNAEKRATLLFFTFNGGQDDPVREVPTVRIRRCLPF